MLYCFHIDQVLKIPKPSTLLWRASQAKDTEIPTQAPQPARPSVVRGKPSASARCLQLSSWWDQWGCLPEWYAGYLGSTKVGWKNYATLSTIQDRFLIIFDHLETIEAGIWASLTKDLNPQVDWLFIEIKRFTTKTRTHHLRFFAHYRSKMIYINIF